MIDHPTIVLARRLALHSLRVRSVLVLVEKSLHRTHDDRHPIHMLERLCFEVLADLGVTSDSEFYETAALGRGEPIDYVDALEWMADYRYVRTSIWQQQQWLALREGADPRLLRWLDAVIDHFRTQNVPLFPAVIVQSRAVHAVNYVTGSGAVAYEDCPFCQGFAVELGHCQFGIQLPGLCWEIVRAVGDEIASRQKIAVDGVPGMPEQWIMTGWRELRQQAPPEPEFPDRYCFGRSPGGEREMLLRYYGIGTE